MKILLTYKVIPQQRVLLIRRGEGIKVCRLGGLQGVTEQIHVLM